MLQRYKPIVLIVLDGWGVTSNQTSILNTTPLPTIEKLNYYYPLCLLQASGISVGLPWGEPGNSEVGHMTIGAGKIIYQNLPRITLAIQDGTFDQNEALLRAVTHVREHKSALHLMGLVGAGAVHSSIQHLHALLEFAKTQNIERVFVHAFTDGRDSPPTSGTKAIRDLEGKMMRLGIGKIASIGGRSWGMDRNNNWDRIEKAYRVFTEGTTRTTTDAFTYLQESYAAGITDEFIEPACVVDKTGAPIGLIQENDAVVFFNFREDRARQMTKAFALDTFEGFKRIVRPHVLFVTMTEYERGLPVSAAFPPETVSDSLGEILSKYHLRQLRIAETEKYAHVTYFFNCGHEEPWTGEDHILVPSLTVSTFDQAPHMSADQITDKILAALDKGTYDFILANYANADMVGHTGNEEACRVAVTVIDQNLGRLIPAILAKGGCVLITADHGNVEETHDFHTGMVNTEHSANPVPLWFATPDNHLSRKSHDTIVREYMEVRGLLSDVAPTILELFGIQKPRSMHGESLLSTLK